MTTQRTQIPVDSFKIIVEPPQERFSTACVTIHEDGKFIMNGKLSRLLGGSAVQIRFTETCRNMCVFETDREAIRFSKRGARTIPDLIPLLKNKGIVFPAKYEFWYSESTGSWQGEYVL